MNLKRQGELAELAFLHKAAKLGFIVSKPWGDSAPYDFIVDALGCLSRVQVKSVAASHHGAWRVPCGNGCSSKTPYTAADIDFLAAYIIPLDTWYLIPVAAFSPVKGLRLRPGSKRKFEPFREAWPLLRSGH